MPKFKDPLREKKLPKENNNEVEKRLRKEFMSKPNEWRIEAIIHDGSWYDIPKWSKLAKVPISEVEDYVRKHKKTLITGEDGENFRYPYKEVSSWYEKQGLSLEERIVPKNFPPKVWDGQTEMDAFAKAPRRNISLVQIVAHSPELLERCKEVVRGHGKVRHHIADKYKIYCLSGDFIRKLIYDNFTEDEVEKLNPRVQANQKTRELSDFSQEFVDKATEFYLEYTKVILTPHRATLDMFLGDLGEKEAQILEWIWKAIKKFDNEKCVPFSGYLAGVLTKWPYDLPIYYLGKELSAFRKQKTDAAKKMLAEDSTLRESDITPEMYCEEMKIPFKTFLRLNEEYSVWDKQKNTEEYGFEDSNNERKGTSVWAGTTVKRNYSMMNALSLASLLALMDTDDFTSFNAIIECIDNEEANVEKVLKTLSKDFLATYVKELTDLMSNVSFDNNDSELESTKEFVEED